MTRLHAMLLRSWRWLACALFAGSALAAPRLAERPLGDVAVIPVPAALDAARYPGHEDELMHREAFQFESRYLWASMGGVMRYRQWLVVSVMAADAPDGAWVAPRGGPLSYESRRPARSEPVGSGVLQTTETVYALGAERVRAFEYLYNDRARRLQIYWHAVDTEHDPSAARAVIERMAAGFRLLRDPAPQFAERRAGPAREAARREQHRAMARAMLEREGYGAPEPGRPVWRRGAWLEVMNDPEPRYQLLVPLGRVRAPADGAVARRPRPLAGTMAPLSIGWQEFADGAWVFSNRDNGYLPLPGIAARLGSARDDTGDVHFFVAGTVRIDEETDPARLQSLAWFFDALPAVQQRWQAGTLVGPGRPEAAAPVSASTSVPQERSGGSAGEGRASGGRSRSDSRTPR